MRIGYAYGRALALNHQEALYSAAEILVDHIIDDLVAIRGRSWKAQDSAFVDLLPQRYLSRYTPQFMRQFHACFLTVVWKLGQRDRILLSCVAEELAAYALIQEATAVLEIDENEVDFTSFEDELFEDMDFEFLYSNAYDGIEETKLAEEAGIVNLAFADWFPRFGPPSKSDYLEPHPLAWNDKQFIADSPEDDDDYNDEE